MTEHDIKINAMDVAEQALSHPWPGLRRTPTQAVWQGSEGGGGWAGGAYEALGAE